VRTASFNLKPARSSLLVTLLSVMCATAASTDSFWFARNWQADKGLPNNTIFGLAQTADGYLWLGTSVGLVSFDGNRFQKYAFTNSIYQGNRGVLALLRSRNGGLWAGMDRGAIVYLNGDASKVFTPKEGLADAQVRSLAEDREGTLWIAYLGNSFYQIKGDKVIALPTRQLPGEVTSMACDKNGDLWVTAAGQAWLNQNNRFISKARAVGSIRCISAAGAGGIWMANSKSHLLRCDAEGQVADFGEINPALPGDAVSALHDDARGVVWIGTLSGGLFRFEDSRFECATVLHPQVESLLEDREGNIWAGTQGGGLYQVCRRVIQLAGLDSRPPFEVVSSLCPDASGGLWAVTEDGRLAHRADGHWQVVTNPAWSGESFVCATAGGDGTLWVASRSRKLHRWQDNAVEDLPDAPSAVQALLGSSTGALWIGGLNFLECWRGGHLRTFSIPAEAHSIRALAEDSQGRIWAGSSRGLLFQIQGDEAAPVTFPNQGTASSIRCLMAGTDGSIWLGHAGLGVSRIKDGHYARVGTEQGLFDDYVGQMIEDEHGWVWFGSDRGIFKVRQQELEAVLEGRAERVGSILFGPEEGMPNLQANFGRSPQTARSGDGRLWMPTHSGLAVVDPEGQTENGKAPQVLLEKVILDGRVLAQYKNVLPTLPDGEQIADLKTPPGELRLPPDYRRLTIEFTTLTFSAVENIYFRYRLAGLDRDWLDAGNQRSASYSRLSSGTYHFEVQVRTAEGTWNDPGPMLGLTVLPYFWQTWWFITSGVVLALGTVGGTVRYIEKRRMRRELARLEREHAIERERTRIARDIHDDLGASLTRITMLSQSALSKSGSPKPATAEVSRIYDTARSMTNAMDEIVWAINPSNDTLESLAAYFAECVQEFLGPTGLAFRLDIPLALPTWKVSSEVRHNLFLAFKEALNNVVKHAKATEVVVTLQVQSGGFVLSVEDNGCGFDRTGGSGNGAVSARHGNGLTNMSSRLEQLGGYCLITSQMGRGTRVAFEIELHRETKV
jgi:signal transduction histidine kinase/ligand-binding sensor domain-containing protein